MNHASKLEHGMMLGGRYRIDRKLGEGGMSCVYLAEDIKLPGKKWAIKESVTQPGMFQTVQAEAELLTTLNHARLPRIIDFFQPDEAGYTYMVMDYIQGMTLDKYCRQYRGHLSADFILQLTHQLLEVLEYLHTHQPPVVFRDLKPSNIMLTEEMEVRLIDFGIARCYKQERSEDTVKLGTVGFAAPEQYGGGQSDARSDLYGLGALLLYLITGGKYSEWFAGVEQHIRGDISKMLPPVIKKLLQYDPNQRFQSVHEVRQCLASSLISDRGLASRTQSIAGTLVTAVLGTSPGIGTTHSSITIGHFLARKYNKVAIIEMGTDLQAFTRIQEIAEGSPPGSVRKFTINSIDFWRQTARGDVISLLAGGYDAVVLDLGAYRDNERLEEFIRADVPIIIGSAAEWRQQDVLTLVRMLARHEHAKRVYALPLASAKSIQQLRRLLGSNKVLALPLHTDPFSYLEETEKAIEHIYEGIIKPKERRRRFRFAWG
ncbi:serine/threonine protein kinase [Paenibacillus sp. EC2-1]|uniref:serine/threonine protein kinase n=1 Tax=Paenibacillus sp. EC2-1 TaxID=3388665 RepID=UPI003BEEEBF2